MYLSALFTEISRSYIQKLIDTWCVLVNGQAIKKNLKLELRDELQIREIITSVDVLPENIPLDIPSNPWGRMKEGNTCECCFVSLSLKTSSDIIIIKNREIKKYYIAVVSWVFTQEKFTIESDIGRSKTDKTKMTASNPINPKHAITHGEVLWYIDNTYSVLKIDLETGRTHQIRVHLASIGYPILWDSTYWNPRVNTKVATLYQLHRQALHAYKLEFELGWKKQDFIAPLKADMRSMIPKSLL